MAGTPTLWTPLPGPQTEALNSPAEEIFFGGAAGGGKTDFLIGLSATQHRRSIIFRREFKQLMAIRDRTREVYSRFGSYNGQDYLWRLDFNGPRLVYLAGVQNPGDEAKYQGHNHDLKAFDEVTHFTLAQYEFLIGWNRTAIPGQRSRIVAAGNPPTNATGYWVIQRWAPWLDAKHPKPAKPGELRWFARLPDKYGKMRDTEVDGPEPIIVEGEPDPIYPRSRTFIRALLKDNPYYEATGYRKVLQAMPEPLRSQMLYGDFGAGQQDADRQVIPTAWVLAAQARWTPEPPSPIPDAIGADIARGGSAQTVLTPRHEWWFGEQTAIPGDSTPDGWSALQRIIQVIPTGTSPDINIDIIGVGSSVFDLAVAQRLSAVAMDARHASGKRDRSGKLGFANKRAEWWWGLREALDPLLGDDLALPPDQELLADLTAPLWEATTRGILIESKDDIIERLGRSTDKGDSLVMAHATNPPVRRTHLL